MTRIGDLRKVDTPMVGINKELEVMIEDDNNLITAADVENTPAGNISATTTQAAIDELDAQDTALTARLNIPRLPLDEIAGVFTANGFRSDATNYNDWVNEASPWWYNKPGMPIDDNTPIYSNPTVNALGHYGVELDKADQNYWSLTLVGGASAAVGMTVGAVFTVDASAAGDELFGFNAAPDPRCKIYNDGGLRLGFYNVGNAASPSHSCTFTNGRTYIVVWSANDTSSEVLVVELPATFGQSPTYRTVDVGAGSAILTSTLPTGIYVGAGQAAHSDSTWHSFLYRAKASTTDEITLIHEFLAQTLVAAPAPPSLPGVFVSTEQTGDGNPQNIAHGLGVVPTQVFVSVTDLPDAAAETGFVITEGAHTSTNVVVTVTNTVKYKVLAYR